MNIAVADLVTNWSDLDGDTLSRADVSVSTNSVTLTNDAGTLVYFNSNNIADQFACTISDGWGGTNFQIVNLVLASPADPAPRITGVVGNPGGSFNLALAGAPDRTYILETCTDLTSSFNWLPVAMNTPGPNGVWQFNDEQATNFQQRFYRLQLRP